jgi:hypothetical protein
MPSQDRSPSLEMGPFYCIYEDERWDEPEIIVDPVTGFVVAIFPPRDRPRRPRKLRNPPRFRSLWRDRLIRWLHLAGVSTALVLFAVVPGHAAQTLLKVSCDPTREFCADYGKFFGETVSACFPAAPTEHTR